MWNSLSPDGPKAPVKGLALDVHNEGRQTMKVQMPLLPDLTQPSQGLTISMWIRPDHLPQQQFLLNSRNQAVQGIRVSMIRINEQAEAAFQIELSHDRESFVWHTDPGHIKAGSSYHVVFVVDAGPRILSAFVNGVMNDGAGFRQFGWIRYPEDITDVNGNPTPKISPPVRHLQVFTRYLRACEVVGLYRSQRGLYASP